MSAPQIRDTTHLERVRAAIDVINSGKINFSTVGDPRSQYYGRLESIVVEWTSH